MKRKFLPYALRFVAVVVIGNSALLVASVFSPRAHDVLMDLVGFGSKVVMFPKLAWTRAEGCPISAAWIPDPARYENDPLARLCRVVRRDSAGFELIETPKQGRWWIPAGDLVTLAHMLEDEEREIYEEGGHGVKPGDVVLDCGANVGAYTKRALESGAKIVVAIEIAPENIECLRRNFAQEISAGKVIVYPKGVWDRDDHLTLYRQPNRSSSDDSVVFHGEGSSGPIVPLTTIDNLVTELHLQRVDFIKMDIEGAERPALRGARRTISSFRPAMAITVEHRSEDRGKIPLLLKEMSPSVHTEWGRCTRIIFRDTDQSRVQPSVLFASFVQRNP